MMYIKWAIDKEGFMIGFGVGYHDKIFTLLLFPVYIQHDFNKKRD